MKFHLIPYCTSLHPKNGDYLQLCYPEIMPHIYVDKYAVVYHVPHAFTLNSTVPRRIVLRTFSNSIQH